MNPLVSTRKRVRGDGDRMNIDRIFKILIAMCLSLSWVFLLFYVASFYNPLVLAKGEIECGVSSVCMEGPIYLLDGLLVGSLVLIPLLYIFLFVTENNNNKVIV